ncbi:MAG TPA: tetratricopeptide repeat protein [Candidatus Limnocylindria bacterium]|nr:tetratricopeptide repeat protein [Candidatus Limnocylindria bacterium]
MGAFQKVNVRFLCLLTLLFVFGLARARAAAESTAEFDQANKFYEQGKFPEAAAVYEALARSEPARANVWFNLGNAAYKAGELGRAIAAYRVAERLAPRDSALRANLQFVRGKVYGDDRSRVPLWKSAIRLATFNEWTALTAILLWGFFAVLACGEVTRRKYPKTVLLLLLFTVSSGVALTAAVRDQFTSHEAVVTAREVTVRFGPLDESQPAFQLRDGAEVIVSAMKSDWLQVSDAEKRSGWMRRSEARVLTGVLTPGSVEP